MTWVVELQVDHIREIDEAQAVLAVRCLGAPLRIGAHLRQIHDGPPSIDLEVTRILSYGQDVAELDPAHTALVTLRGTGTRLLTAGSPAGGWQIIRGTNPGS